MGNILFLKRGAFRNCREVYTGFRSDLNDEIQIKKKDAKREESRLRYNLAQEMCFHSNKLIVAGSFICIVGSVVTISFASVGGTGLIVGGVIVGVGVSLFCIARIFKYFEWKNMDKRDLLQLQRELKRYDMMDKYLE